MVSFERPVRGVAFSRNSTRPPFSSDYSMTAARKLLPQLVPKLMHQLMHQLVRQLRLLVLWELMQQLVRQLL